MIKAVITLSLILIFTLHSNAQNLDALLKYEAAVNAYQANDFEKSLNLLDEAEKIAGQTTASVLHLRIVVGDKMIEKQGGFLKVDFSQIEALNQLCNRYTAMFGQTAGMESRLNDVKGILNRLPKSKSVHDAQIAQHQDQQNSERNLLLKQRMSMSKQLRSTRTKMWLTPAIGVVVAGGGIGLGAWAKEKYPEDKDKRETAKLIGVGMIGAGALTVVISTIMSRKHKYRINQLKRDLEGIDTKLGALSFDYRPSYNPSMGTYAHHIGAKLMLGR